jgi:hypothetical protein
MIESKTLLFMLPLICQQYDRDSKSPQTKLVYWYNSENEEVYYEKI